MGEEPRTYFFASIRMGLIPAIDTLANVLYLVRHRASRVLSIIPLLTKMLAMKDNYGTAL